MSKNEKNNRRKAKKEDKRKTKYSNSPSSPSSPPTSPALSLPLPAHPSQIANWKEEKKRRKAEQKALRKHQKEQLNKQKRSTCCCCCLCCLPSGRKRGQWNSDDELNEAEQQMQKKTFTNWVNFRLEEHSSSGRVTDLFIDMRDGVLLCRLLEVLTGQVLLVTTESAVVAVSKNGQSNGKIQRRHSSGGVSSKQRVHHLANLSAALKCLRENGLQLLGNSAAELADGNPHVWLSLVWQIILHFQVEQNLSLLRQSVWHQIHQQQADQKCHHLALPGTSNGGGTAAIVTRTTDSLPKEGIERQMIKWVTDEVIGDLGLRVRDFDRSWCDGRLFCALVHRFAPALMSRGEVLGGGNDGQSAQRRTERAMEVARLHLGIRPLLEARDVTVSEYVPDKRSLIAYVSQFVRLRPHQMIHSLVPISSAVPADVSVVAGQCQQKKEMEEEKFFVFKEWLHWLHSVAADERLKLVARQRITIRHFIWFTQMREEFWERRAAIVDHLLVAIRKSATEEAEGEKTTREIEDEMEQLECAIDDWECHLCTYFPDSHSAQLASLSDWISSGERLLSSSEYNGIDQLLNAGQVDETLRRLEAAIGRLEQFFRILADQRALLYELEHQIGSVSPFDSLSSDSLLQPMHLLGDLRRRFDALSEKQRNAMAQMLFEQCRFRVLEKLGILKSKIRIWKTQLNGEQQTRQTLDEWTEFATKEKPNEACEHLLSSLQNAIPTPYPNQSAHHYELHNWSLRVHNQLTKEFRREIRRFFEFGKILEELANFWTKFEMADKQMQSQTVEKDKWTEKMNECEELAAKIGTIGAELTETAADEAKKRIKEIGKRRKRKTEEEEVQQGKQFEEVNDQKNQFVGEKNRGNAEPSENGTEAMRNTAFWKWQMIGEELARKRPKDEEELINLIDWLQDLGKDFPTAEASLKRWAAQSPPIVATNEKQSQIARFGAVHRSFLDQLGMLDSFKGRFIHLEKVLTDLEQWTIHHDPDSEMATKSVGERAQRIQWATKELAELTSLCAQTFDFSSLAVLNRRIRSSFTLVEFRRIEIQIEVVETLTLVAQRRRLRKSAEGRANFTQPNEFEDQIGHQLACQSIATDLAHLQIAIPSTSNVLAAIEQQELCVVEAAEDATLERISSLRSRLAKVDLDTAQTGPSSTQKVDLWALLKKKRIILARDESSEEEARASLREMALIDEELGDELKGNAEFEKLSRQWTSKKAELDRLMMLNDQLKQICGRLDEGQGEEANAEELETELDALARSLATTALAHSDNGTSAAALPLHRQFIRRVETIKKRIHRRMAEEQRQQRHALMHKIEALKMSPEGDLPVALEVAEEVLQEAAALVQRNISSSDQQIAEDRNVGAEQYTDQSSSHPFPLPPPHFSSTESLRLISEAQQLQKVLCMKMELLNRLERLERTLEEIERDNGGWDVILSGQVEAVLGVLANWLKQLNDQLAPEQSQLDTLFAQNGDNFIQIESERMGRRMDRVREKISELKTVMEHRQMFLIKMCAFKALFEKCMEKAQSEKQIKGKETKKTQLELNALKTQILGAVPELFEAQTNARISVPDIDLQRMIDQILGDSIGPSTSPLPPPLSSRANELLNSFMTLASQLHNSLDLSLESFQFGTFSPSQFADKISQFVASEEASLNELLRLSVSISSLVPSPQTNAAADTLQMLKERLHKRHNEHQIRIEEMSARCLRAFRDRLASLEAQLESAIQKKEAERLNGLEREEYSELRKELDQFDKTFAKSANGTDQKAHWPRKWAKRLQQLHNNLNIFGNNLANAKIAIGAREERKELKLVHHLSAFGKWLDLIEHEMLQLHSPDQSADPFESDRSERRVKLTKLRDNCVQHFRLVVKLQTHQFASEEQAEQAHTLCQQYRKVMEQFEKMRLPISHLIPVKKAEETHDGNGDNKRGGGITERTQSQLSLDSSTPSDLDSDLASLHSEVLVAEALSHHLSSDFPCSSSTPASSTSAPVENVFPSIGLVRQIAAKATKSDAKSEELPMEEIENEVQQLLLAIDHMHTRYYTPKSLDEAQSDASSLKLLAKQLTELKTDLKTVAAIASVDEHKKHLQKLSSNLKREKNGLKRFHRELADEIEAEIALRTNYAQTAEHLAQLDVEVRSAAAEGRVPQTEAMLRRIELQMEMLKKQCRATRKFVEMSVDGAASTSPTRRRRIIFRLSSTVTTIIQVIERKLRQGEAEAKKGGSGRETMSESEAEELTKLHQKLTALKRETEETEMEEKVEERAKKQTEEKRTETHTELTELEHGKQQQSDEREEQEDQSDFLVQAEQMVEKSEMVRLKLEELIGAEGELPESGQQQSPLIRKVRSELIELLTELEKGDKKGQQKNQAIGKCEAKLAELIRAFDELDSKYNEKLEKQKRRMDKVIGDGEKLLKDPEASIEQFQAAIDSFEAIYSEIEAEIKQRDTPVFVSNELIRGLNQMKPIKERMEREYSLAKDTKMALEEGAEVMKRLREERSKLDTFTKLGEEAEGIVQTMTILGQKLKVTAEKLRALDVELPIQSDIDKHLAIIDEVEKEMAKERNKRAMQEEEEKLGKWPEKVTEVNMEVFLTRTEAEEVEDESVKKVIMNVSKRREWDKEETDQKREGKAIRVTEEKPKEERTALLNAANELDEQVRQAHALEEPQEQISELDKLHNQLERVEQQMRTVDQQSEQYPTPQKATTLSEQIAHVVHKTKTNIEDARHQQEERIAQNARKEQLRDRAVRLDASLTALVNQAHDKLNESAAMPQCYEQLCNGLAEQIELAEQFGAENGITVGGEERIAQAKEVREQLAQRWHHWGEFVRLRDLGTAQLDKARVAIDQTEQKACRSLAEAESDHDNLLVSVQAN
ncbi:hypothetical protein niasHT_007739 [Heterodera trifolii]|uniref:Calponin-homology (CH) domain-containing protein n=1 Tax=Heterodera trifolii TaxID=157864 RepID=A0ABD2MAB3_9BILA